MRTLFVLFILSISVLKGSAQKWQANDDNSYELNFEHYSEYSEVFKAYDSTMLFFSIHKNEDYFAKNIRERTTVLLHKITKDKKVRLIKKLPVKWREPTVKLRNEKYYVLDNYFQSYKDTTTYTVCYVFTKDWELIKQVKLPRLKYTNGVLDYNIDSNENYLVFTYPQSHWKWLSISGSYIYTANSIGLD